VPDALEPRVPLTGVETVARRTVRDEHFPMWFLPLALATMGKGLPAETIVASWSAHDATGFKGGTISLRLVKEAPPGQTLYLRVHAPNSRGAETGYNVYLGRTSDPAGYLGTVTFFEGKPVLLRLPPSIRSPSRRRSFSVTLRPTGGNAPALDLVELVARR
jgi:hypothetical protein